VITTTTALAPTIMTAMVRRPSYHRHPFDGMPSVQCLSFLFLRVLSLMISGLR
jgi:hypothetical protein